MSTSDKIGIHDLHAFVDGELDQESQHELERLLNRNPEDQRSVKAYKKLNAALHDYYAGVADEPMPASLLATIEKSKQQHRKKLMPLHQNNWLRLAAGFLIFAVGLASGLALRPTAELVDGASAFASRALNAHAVFVSEVLHPVEVEANKEAHLVKWLTNRLKAPVKAPNLQNLGFQLVGGRLLSDQNGPAAQLMYQQKNGMRVTLYIRSDDSNTDTSFRFITQNGGSAFYWVEGMLSYALVGTIPRDALLSVANKVYSDLQSRPQS